MKNKWNSPENQPETYAVRNSDEFLGLGVLSVGFEERGRSKRLERVRSISRLLLELILGIV